MEEEEVRAEFWNTERKKERKKGQHNLNPTLEMEEKALSSKHPRE